MAGKATGHKYKPAASDKKIAATLLRYKGDLRLSYPAIARQLDFNAPSVALRLKGTGKFNVGEQLVFFAAWGINPVGFYQRIAQAGAVALSPVKIPPNATAQMGLNEAHAATAFAPLRELIKKELGVLLADLRKEKGHSMLDVAGLLGKSKRKSYIFKIENGEVYLNYSTLLSLLTVYGCELPEVIGKLVNRVNNCKVVMPV